MLHPIKIPNCEPQISKALEIVRLTLMFGLCNDSSTISGDIRSNVDISRLFLEHFIQHGYPETGPWLWNKPVAIVQPLMQLLQIPLHQKQDILHDFDEDIQLEQSFQSGHFYYSSLPDSPALYLVKIIMVNFYDRILTDEVGIPANVINESNGFNRVTILKAFVDANPNLVVCPGCDGSTAILDDKFANTDADHFFPISKYPFLSIHPLNLTPFCLACNTKFKKAKDALQASGVTSFADIYHPYFCPAREEITVMVERDQSNGEPVLHLRAKQNDAQYMARLNSLNYILDLERRWQLVLTQNRLQIELDSSLGSAASFFGDEGGLFRNRFDDEWFSHKLSIAIAGWRGYIGRKEWYVPFIAYTRWVSVDAQSRNEWRSKMLKVLEAPNKEYDIHTGQVRTKN